MIVPITTVMVLLSEICSQGPTQTPLEVGDLQPGLSESDVHGRFINLQSGLEHH
jgi:hypothetical protein